MKTTSVKYLGYKITPHTWTETHERRGQYGVFIERFKTHHTGFKVTKGKRNCGNKETLAECKALVRAELKYNSKKCKMRIRELILQEAKLFKIAQQREQSPNERTRKTAQYFYDRSRIAGRRAFNLEIGRPENSR